MYYSRRNRIYSYGRSYGRTFKEAFKRDELAYELAHEDEAQGTYNPYARTRRSYPSKPIGTIDNENDTFDGWKARGKWVKKGSKSKAKTTSGQALFHISQVR